MSKKRFTEGLESIFGDTAADTLQEDSPLLTSTAEPTTKPKKKRSGSGKNFSDDLQLFLQEAFEESVSQRLDSPSQPEPEKQPEPQVRKRHRRPLGGLDALIRSTVKPENIRVQPQSSNSKRVTLVFDLSKLEQLKAIARDRKAYLQDVVDEIVEEYLSKDQD